MTGHECRLSQTNNYGWVPLCECGWIGDVVPHVQPLENATQRSLRVRELTQAIARARHGAHLEEMRAEHVRRSNLALAAIGSNIRAANQTLQRRGRWGQP